MDMLGPLPESKEFKCVYVVVYVFSKCYLLYALYRQGAYDVKRVFTKIVSLHGTPYLIVNDRSRMFESNTFQNWFSDLCCTTQFITHEVRHENGQAERHCRTVQNLLQVEINNKSSE